MKKVISICGSMKFYPEMEELKFRLEVAGYSIFLPEAEESENYYPTS